MTLTMDSLCPHIAQSKTRVLKSDMENKLWYHFFGDEKSYNNFRQLLFLGTFLVDGVLDHKHALRDVQKSPRRAPKPSLIEIEIEI